MKRHWTRSGLQLLLAFAVVLAAFVEIWLAMCVGASVYVCYAEWVTLLAVPFFAWRPSIRKLIPYSVFLLCLVLLYVVPWNSRKPFLKRLNQVQWGMTRVQVESIMSGYMQGTGWPAGMTAKDHAPVVLQVAGSDLSFRTSASPSGELEIDDSIVFRHSNDGRFNSDFGVVTFHGGKVAEVSFLPD